MHLITLQSLALASPQQVFDYACNCMVVDQTTDKLNFIQCLFGETGVPSHKQRLNWVMLSSQKLVPKHHAGLLRRLQLIFNECPIYMWNCKLKCLAFECGFTCIIFNPHPVIASVTSRLDGCYLTQIQD